MVRNYDTVPRYETILIASLDTTVIRDEILNIMIAGKNQLFHPT